MKNVPLGLKQAKQHGKGERHPLKEVIHTYIATEAWETSDLINLPRHALRIRKFKKKTIGSSIAF